MAQRKQRNNVRGRPNNSKVKTAALIVGSVLAFGAVAGGLAVALDQNDYRDLATFNYRISSLDANGAIIKNGKTQLVTDYVNVKGLKVMPRADSKVTFKILYYDEFQDFLSMTEDMTTAFNATTVPIGAVFARVGVTPIDDEDGVISLLEKADYANQLIITVARKTPKVTARGKLTGANAYMEAMKRDGNIVATESTMFVDDNSLSTYRQHYNVPVNANGNMDFSVSGYLRTYYENIAQENISHNISNDDINNFYYGVHLNIVTYSQGIYSSKGCVRSDKYQTVNPSFMTIKKVEASPELLAENNWKEYCKVLSSSYVTIHVTSDADTVTISYDFKPADTYKDKYGFIYDIPDYVVGEYSKFSVKYVFDKGEDFENFSVDLMPTRAVFIQL